mmetsp:Transcript_45532/g.106271  ORF Transcript_45532/g.106271 Transcript_45532/m.106271 type:complete len:260 (-) Transcript_45532:194-973(-)
MANCSYARLELCLKQRGLAGGPSVEQQLPQAHPQAAAARGERPEQQHAHHDQRRLPASKVNRDGGEDRTEARQRAPRPHCDEEEEVRQVARSPRAGDAPSKNAAVVIEVDHTPVARAAVVGPPFRRRRRPPQQAAHAVRRAALIGDVPQILHRRRDSQALLDFVRHWEARGGRAADDARVAEDQPCEADERNRRLKVEKPKRHPPRGPRHAAHREGEYVRQAHAEDDDREDEGDAFDGLRAHHFHVGKGHRRKRREVRC